MPPQRVFITGASGGIGRALSLRLARDGAHIALAARRAERLEDLAREIRAAGSEASVHVVDVRDVEDLTRTIRAADDAVGGLDLVIANAGIGTHRFSGKLSWADCEPTLRVNVDGAVATLVALMDRMVERRRGHLVGISSLAQYRGLPKSAVYSASKAFLSTFLEGLRVDLRTAGIAVTDVRPGFVRTEMTEKNTHPMPFILDAPEAAEIIARGVAAKAPVVAFPWQLATVVRSASVLPPAIYDRAVTRARG
jgi:short-subunit dehydrogenase